MKVAQATPPAAVAMQAGRLRYAGIAMEFTYLSFCKAIHVGTQPRLADQSLIASTWMRSVTSSPTAGTYLFIPKSERFRVPLTCAPQSSFL